MKKSIKAGLLGVAIGDALGVPVEFFEKSELDKKPVTDMIGFGTHNQPAGTWSDDTSLTLCLAESLLNGNDLEDIARKFIMWEREAYWSARGGVFDIGITTIKSIDELKQELLSKDADLTTRKYAGNERDNGNGNGSLMRIFPLLVEFLKTEKEKRFELVWDVSALTHKHIRAAIACYIYLVYAEYLWNGMKKNEAYKLLRNDITKFFLEKSIAHEEIGHFDRLIKNDIRLLKENQMLSGGYVIETLEASFWSFLTTDTFLDCLLRGINLGHDTDTTGAVIGGLAGMYYGVESIPEFWIVQLARMEDIIDLGEKLELL